MSATTIHDILAQFRDEELHNRHLGDRFERLICRYLELDPIFADQFSNVWMWNEWPQKGNIGDVGIDVVAEERATRVSLETQKIVNALPALNER